MEPEKTAESSQFAGKLYQAVLSLQAGVLAHERHIHRMAQALAFAKVMGSSNIGHRHFPRVS
jgi:hypothetical protein